MKQKLFALVCLAASVFIATPPPVAAQAQSTNPRYGLSAWAVNGQRVASQYNYDLDSNVSQGAALGLYQFPSFSCTNALAFGNGKNVNPFNTNATVKVSDIVSANTETVALTAVTVSGGVCSLSLSTSNTHANGSYHLRSGTCGLKEAQNDKGSNAGTIIVDQKFYDDGCSASTITSLVGGVAGDYVVDISNGQFNVYGWTGSAFVLMQQLSNNHYGFGNADIIGTKTLSGGAGTVTFTKAYTAAPICVGTDQTAANAVKISTTTTTATFAGTTTDVIAYMCFANPN